ncbi:MAG: hypothetical protein IK139_01160 [Lachnospiraceae bacterium]|nr:hypothetical protein [Lachnospiraceae bacterium]
MNSGHNAVRYDEIQFELMMQLGDYVHQGIPLYFENAPSTPRDIVNNLMTNQDEVYMADYVRDDRGNLSQIRYDKVGLPDRKN